MRPSEMRLELLLLAHKCYVLAKVVREVQEVDPQRVSLERFGADLVRVRAKWAELRGTAVVWDASKVPAYAAALRAVEEVDKATGWGLRGFDLVAGALEALAEFYEAPEVNRYRVEEYGVTVEETPRPARVVLGPTIVRSYAELEEVMSSPTEAFESWYRETTERKGSIGEVVFEDAEGQETGRATITDVKARPSLVGQVFIDPGFVVDEIRPGDDWRDPANLAALPTDAVREAALRVADALDAFYEAKRGVDRG